MNQEQVKVEVFIKSLGLSQYITNVLFHTMEDCKLFFDKFYQNNRYEIDDLLDFREYKVESSTWTSPIFVKSCKSDGMRQTFEKAFFQSFTDQDIVRVEKAMLNEKITLESLFSQFKANPNTNIMKYIL